MARLLHVPSLCSPSVQSTATAAAAAAADAAAAAAAVDAAMVFSPLAISRDMRHRRHQKF